MHRFAISLTLVASSLVMDNVLGAQTATSMASRSTVTAPQRRGGPVTPNFTLLGGLASGDGAWNMGPAVAGTITWSPAPQVDIRVDPYYARHDLDVRGSDAHLTFLGVGGNVQYVFRTANSGSAAPYVFGGIGVYHQNFGYGNDVFASRYGNGSTDLGLGVGTGIRFANHLVVELRVNDINSFTSVPILFGYRF